MKELVRKVPALDILGYWVGNGIIKPDPERPIQELPVTTNLISLRRAVRMFAYYAKWIPRFSDKIQPLIKNKNFPLNATAIQAFKTLKKQLEIATLQN